MLNVFKLIDPVFFLLNQKAVVKLLGNDFPSGSVICIYANDGWITIKLLWRQALLADNQVFFVKGCDGFEKIDEGGINSFLVKLASKETWIPDKGVPTFK